MASYVGAIMAPVIIVFSFVAGIIVVRGGPPVALVPLTTAASSRFRHPAATIALGTWRVFVAAYTTTLLVLYVGHKEFLKYDAFFYTVWNFAILAAYFLLLAGATISWAVAGGHRAKGCAAGYEPVAERRTLVWPEASEAPSAAADTSEAARPEPSEAPSAGELRLGRALQILSSVVFANVLMVDITVWTLLFPIADAQGRRHYLSFFPLNMHAANFLFVIVEATLHAIPPRGEDVGYVWMLASIYAGFTFLHVALTPSTQHCITQSCDLPILTLSETDYAVTFPYLFLDTSRGILSPIMNLMAYLFLSLFYWVTFRYRLLLER